MVEFETKPNGEIDDRVRVVFKGFETRIFENYSVKMAVLQQPNAFTVRLGGLEPPKEIFKRYPPGTPFQLAIGPVAAFTGVTDGYESSGDANGGSTVLVKGRDILAKLQDAEFRADKSFVDVTYADLVYEVMVEAGGLEEAAILSSNEANVTVRSGVGVTKKPGTTKQLGDGTPAPGDPILEGGAAGALTGATITTPGTYTTHARMGEKCLEWLRTHLEKAGLMLWTDVNGDIVVSAPNANQAPRYRFIRKRGEARSVCNVLSHNFRNDTTKRFSSVVVFGRGPGRKSGKGKIRGEFFDVEMLSLLEPRRRTKSFRDVNVFDELQAINHARNRLAEINRNAWQLSYVIQGHTAPTPSGGRAVITPDTIAQVEDDELGISGLFYVEAVEYSSPPTTTTVTLMRLTDCMWDKDPTIVEQVEQVTSGRKRRRRKKK